MDPTPRIQEWLESTEELHLVPALVGHRNWFVRLIGLRRPFEPIATIELSPPLITLFRASTEAVELNLHEPFALRLSRSALYADKTHGELTLSACQRDRINTRSAWLHVRTVWPLADVAHDIPEQESRAPCLVPGDFQRFAEALQHFARIHGVELPEGLRFSDTHLALEKVPRSAEKPPRCVGCTSNNLSSSYPGVLTCHDCGYEFGPGMEERDRQRKLDALASMSPADRRATGLLYRVEASALLREQAEDMRQFHAYNVEGVSFVEDAQRTFYRLQNQLSDAEHMLDGVTAALPQSLTAWIQEDPETLAKGDLNAHAALFDMCAVSLEADTAAYLDTRSTEARRRDCQHHISTCVRDLNALLTRMDTLVGLGRGSGGGDLDYLSDLDMNIAEAPIAMQGPSMPSARAGQARRSRSAAMAEAMSEARDAYFHTRCVALLTPELSERCARLEALLEVAAHHPERILGDDEQHNRLVEAIELWEQLLRAVSPVR